MFLKSLINRNPTFVRSAIRLHRSGDIPTNSYVIDLDTLEANTRHIVGEAQKYDLTVFAMTKQIGRNPAALDVIAGAGVDGFVAVDMDCARPIAVRGHKVGHLGHLVQIPAGETAEGISFEPLCWTVFSKNKIDAVANAARKARVTQNLLVRVYDKDDRFYDGHEGGVPFADLPQVIGYINGLEGVHFSGVTTFPALLFNERDGEVEKTPNLATLARAAQVAYECTGRKPQVNAPGTTSGAVLSLLKEAGATQVEPGHGLTGTTPLHAVRDLPEKPAVLYMSEIAHIHQGTPFCFGGGLYIDPVFEPYDVRALVTNDPEQISNSPVPIAIPDPAAIDYYAKLTPPKGRVIQEGDSVVLGFRIQAFVTRAWVVAVSGVRAGSPRVVGVWNSYGQQRKASC